MIVTAQSQGFEMSAGIDRFARYTARTALQRLGENIVAVDIFLKDANGPRGGVDKHALVRVRLRNRQVIALESVHENLYAAIKIAAKRSARAVRRQLRKSQRVERTRLSEQLGDGSIPAQV